MAVAAICALAVSCAGVDQQKFDRVYKAGAALQAEVQSNSGPPRPQSRDLLKELDTEIAALTDHTIGTRSQRRFRRMRTLPMPTGTFSAFACSISTPTAPRFSSKGPNLEAATRYKLPIDTRNGSKWVNRAQAVTILLQAAEQRLNDGNRMVKGR